MSLAKIANIHNAECLVSVFMSSSLARVISEQPMECDCISRRLHLFPQLDKQTLQFDVLLKLFLRFQMDGFRQSQHLQIVAEAIGCIRTCKHQGGAKNKISC